MDSLPEMEIRQKPASRWPLTLEAWNRKLHFYLGLYFLFFLWLFALTGLLLNHQWGFAEFWPQRTETRYEKAIEIPIAASEEDRALDLMRQLDLSGELDLPDRPQQPDRLEFNVARPGATQRVIADLARKQATVQRTEVNSWGIARVLHTFSGVRFNNPRPKRDWVLTTVWVISLDALSAGLVVMILSSYWMWYRLKQKRKLGLIALGAGFISCGFLTAGLAFFDKW